MLPVCLDAGACAPGDGVTAFFAGQVDLGNGPQECTPAIESCFFPAKVASGPDAEGYYTVNWEDGDENNRRVVHKQVRLSATGESCDGASPPPRDDDEDGNWVPPEIPCTILSRLHWEGSDPKWNKEAVESLRKEFKPDEVIDGFDWHVILRFNDADRCEAVFKSLEVVLRRCKEEDQEKCHTHKYVKAIEYVGDEPEVRRQSGRRVHQAKANHRQEL
mmetsp:Transcript_118020/g.204219  ORF Transcript_118020/g.204219 Transcript_118020/m.204219 type:complete len:218 (+) Transcript_118020:3-656(+)